MRSVYETVDGIWYAAGDSATDFSFYTKRVTLAAIYAATLPYWLEDRSPFGNHAACGNMVCPTPIEGIFYHLIALSVS